MIQCKFLMDVVCGYGDCKNTLFDIFLLLLILLLKQRKQTSTSYHTGPEGISGITNTSTFVLRDSFLQNDFT